MGKGVVYDTGGLNIKKAGMERMHGDKGGACTVFGVFRGIVELGLKVNVVCTLALVIIFIILFNILFNYNIKNK